MWQSNQGFKIAFIGTNHTAQTACAEYLRRKLLFKRLNMDEPIRRFLQASYWHKAKANVDWQQRLAFYDAAYKIDNDIFIKYVDGRIKRTIVDTVIYDVRYLNEMKALQEMGFIICRVTTTNTKNLQIGKLVKTADTGTVALSLLYNKNFSANNPANYSLGWVNKATTDKVMGAFLERIEYKVDL